MTDVKELARQVIELEADVERYAADIMDVSEEKFQLEHKLKEATDRLRDLVSSQKEAIRDLNKAKAQLKSAVLV